MSTLLEIFRVTGLLIGGAVAFGFVGGVFGPAGMLFLLALILVVAFA